MDFHLSLGNKEFIGIPLLFLNLNLTSYQLISSFIVVRIDYREAQEFRSVLRRHEESIKYNKYSLFSVNTKVHENEHQCTSQRVMVMNTLVQQKHKIDELEDECNMLIKIVINLRIHTQYLPTT